MFRHDGSAIEANAHEHLSEKTMHMHICFLNTRHIAVHMDKKCQGHGIRHA